MKQLPQHVLFPGSGNQPFRFFRLWRRYALPHLPLLSVGFVLILMLSLVPLIDMYLMMYLIDFGIVMNKDMSVVRSVVLLMIGVAVAAGLLKFVQSWINTVTGERISETLRRDIIDRLHRASLASHHDQISGEWISRMLFDATRFRHYLTGNMIGIAYNLLMIAVVTVFLILINVWITLPVVIVLPTMAAISFFWARRLQTDYFRQRRSWDRVVGYMTERLEGVAEICAYGREDEEIREFERVCSEYAEIHTDASLRRSRFSMYLESISFFALSLLIAWSGLFFLESNPTENVNLLFEGARALMPGIWMLGPDQMMASMGMAEGAALTAGMLSAFVLFIGRFLGPLKELAHKYSEYAQMQASGRRLSEILNMPQEREEGLHIPRLSGHIRLEKVSFGYVPDRPVLKEITMEIRPGQHVAVVGPSGAGKTSLVRLLTRFYEPTQGNIYVDDHPIEEIALSSLRKCVTIVPQEPVFFSGTVMENLRFGKPEASIEEIMEAAKAIGAHEMILRLPRGYETRIRQDGSPLSRGQRQMLALVRAMLADPDVIILDEAVSSMDAKTQVMLMQAVRQLLEGRTAVIVAHQLDVARLADVIFVLDEGKIVESGSPEALLSREGVFSKIWAKWVD